jgi:hypothetical protein
MSTSSPFVFTVLLPGQCDPLLHAVDRLVITGEEAIDVPHSLCAFAILYLASVILC